MDKIRSAPKTPHTALLGSVIPGTRSHTGGLLVPNRPHTGLFRAGLCTHWIGILGGALVLWGVVFRGGCLDILPAEDTDAA